MKAHSIVIAGKKVAVRKRRMSKAYQGTYDRNDHIISIAYHADEPESVVLHEILHSILEITRINQDLTEDQEEALVLAIEDNLYPLIRDGYFNQFKGDKHD